MKKILAILLTVVLMLGVLPLGTLTASAAANSTINGDSAVTVGNNIEFTVKVTGCSDATSIAVVVTYSDNFELVSGTWLKSGSIKRFDASTNKGALGGLDSPDVNGNLFKVVLKAKTASANNQSVTVNVIAKNGPNEIMNVTPLKSVKIYCDDTSHIYDHNLDKICNICGFERGLSGITGDCTWSLNGAVLTISGNGAMGDYGTVSGYITDLSTPPWGGSITKVIIEDGVTSVGFGAFNCCTSLVSISISNSVTVIGNSAFFKCTSLTSISIPDSVTVIGDSAFSNCTSLTSITIHDNITSIGDYTFGSCSSLKTVYYCGTVEEWNNISIRDGNSKLTNATRYYHDFGDWQIKTNATCETSGVNFRVCSICNEVETQFTYGHNFKNGVCTLCNIISEDMLTYTTSNGEATIIDCDTSISGNVTIPSTLGGYPVTSIGRNAFNAFTSLRSITIPDSVKSIGDHAFYNCINLTNITIPDSVKSIGDYAFYNCRSLTSVGIPNNVTSIGNYAFYNCSSLICISIPNSVTSIGYYAFSNCESLTSITIPDSVTSIGSYAFSGCTRITSITIPDSVTSIGTGAFYNCSSLTNIIIPNSVTSIGSQSFANCSNLKTVVLGSGIRNIYLIEYDLGVFYSCYNLESITILDNVLNIGDCRIYASGDYKFKIITSKFSSAYYTAIENNIPVETTGYSAIGSFGDGVWKFNVDNGELTINGNGYIPDTTTDYTAVPWYWYKRDITSIAIGAGIVGIGENVFSQTTNLKIVSLPESLKEIGAGAFRECPNLETINIPETVTEIRPNTFYNCRKLKNIDLSHVLGIGEYAFYRCSALENINLNSTFYVGKYAFNKNTALKMVEFGENLSSINESAFQNCGTSLEKVILPETVDYIDETAFDGCDNVIFEYIIASILGDISGDGKIDAYDLVILKKTLLNITDIGNNTACDLNVDGKINILDFICLYRIFDDDNAPSDPSEPTLEKISELSWGVIEETNYGYLYTFLDFKNNFFGNMGYNKGSEYADVTFKFNGDIYVVNCANCAVYPDSGLDIKNGIDYEDEEYLMFYPYSKEESDSEYIKFQRLNESELQVIENTATGEFNNFTVGKILKLVTIEII